MLPGVDRTKAGTCTRAGGAVTSAAGKKALGEKIDGQIAELAAGVKETKNRNPKPKPEKSKDENKELQKDIRSFLGLKDLYVSYLSFPDPAPPIQGYVTRHRRPERLQRT